MKVTLRNPTRIVDVDGPRRVRELLVQLRINPETVLVIRGADLLTREEEIAPDDEVEIRPVISGGAAGEGPGARGDAPGTAAGKRARQRGSGSRCRRCGERAKVDVPSANAAFCAACFLHFVRNKVTRAIEEHRMIARGDKVLLAVSGGKDSLALWDILLDLGFDTTAYHIVLWTGDRYARESLEMCERFAARRGAPLVVRDLKADEGFTIDQIAREGRRVPCSVCGLTKRHLTNLGAAEGGFDVVATGHNLDDEAATLLGNVLHWTTDFLARQRPVLPAAEPGLVRKVKPLYRVAERETAAYAIVRGIDYIVEECPLVAGNTQLRYKELLNALEERSPGTKQQFLLGFYDKAAELFTEDGGRPELRACSRCGSATPGDVCAYCRAVAPLRLAR